MASITIRNIPDSVLKRIKALSQIERRSMNSELLRLIEKGLNEETEKKSSQANILSSEMQAKMWEELIGEWEDERSSEEIIKDIYAHRTAGRHVEL
jgi:plasmid stability protein